MSARSDLAALLTGNLPAGVHVYAYPADLIKLPAVVITPGDPWLVRGTMGSSSGYTVTLDAILQTPRTNPAKHLEDLEDLIDAFADAIDSSNYKLLEATAPTEIKTGDVEAIGSTVTVVSRLRGGLT